jgi:hypothetical protein
MAIFRPKRPITQDAEYFYADTLENFLKRRPLKKRSRMDGGTNGESEKLLKMQGKSAGNRGE